MATIQFWGRSNRMCLKEFGNHSDASLEVVKPIHVGIDVETPPVGLEHGDDKLHISQDGRVHCMVQESRQGVVIVRG
eukprot:1153151-Pelagomonas_calceolata.AAC.2